MKYFTILGAAVLLASAVMAAPDNALAQDDRSAIEMWAQSCGNCHVSQPARRFTADQWESIAIHMQLAARLTDDETEAILGYLQRGARKPAGSGSDTASVTGDPRRASMDQAVAALEIIETRSTQR